MIRILALFLLFFINFALRAQTIDSLASVRTIHIGDMGIDENATRFRLLLTKEISARGFIATESEYADATISGVLAVAGKGEYHDGRCSAFLTNKDGAILWKWEGETNPPRSFETFVFEPVSSLAFKLASALEKDFKKALKKKAKLEHAKSGRDN
jgi:hypothetical protein